MKKILCLIIFSLVTTLAFSGDRIDILSFGLMMNSYNEEEAGVEAETFAVGIELNGTSVWQNGFAIMVPLSIEFYDSFDYTYSTYTETISGFDGIFYHFPILFGFSPIRNENMILTFGAGPHINMALIDMDYATVFGTFFGISAMVQFNYFFNDRIGLYGSFKYSRDFNGSIRTETTYTSESASGSVTQHHFMPSFGLSIKF